MNITNSIINIFPIADTASLRIGEKISSFQISYITKGTGDMSEETISEFISSIPATEDYKLYFKVGNSDAVTLSHTDPSVYDFIVEMKKSMSYIEDELIFISLEISKQLVNGCRYIYDYNSFCNFWGSNDSLNTLRVLKRDLEAYQPISFLLLEEGLSPFHTTNIYFDYQSHQELNEEYKCDLINENCHFGNYEEFPFNPNCFHIINRPAQENEITKRFDQFKLMFCLCGIYDITSIKEDTLSYKIDGYRSFNGTLNIEDIATTSSECYIKIFNWVYSAASSVNDKVGLTRNILTIYLKDGSVEIPEDILSSIHSSYKTYLQSNVSRYIQMRNNINDELSWISQKSGEVVNDYLSNYQKSIFTYLSFFISVIILKVLQSKDFTNLFTKEPTILSIAFLGLSFIYLIFSSWNLKKEVIRLNRKYDNIKSRYKDLLAEDDINKILRGDEEFKSELKYIKERKKIYTILWIITILGLTIALLSISTYINFQVIYNALS